jgi:hypothetical protein
MSRPSSRPAISTICCKMRASQVAPCDGSRQPVAPWSGALTAACEGGDLPMSCPASLPRHPIVFGPCDRFTIRSSQRPRSHPSSTRQASAVFVARPRSRSRSRPTPINSISSPPEVPPRTSTRTTATAWRPSSGAGGAAFKGHSPSQVQLELPHQSQPGRLGATNGFARCQPERHGLHILRTNGPDLRRSPQNRLYDGRRSSGGKRQDRGNVAGALARQSASRS